jgi:hypothetical protein
MHLPPSRRKTTDWAVFESLLFVLQTYSTFATTDSCCRVFDHATHHALCTLIRRSCIQHASTWETVLPLHTHISLILIGRHKCNGILTCQLINKVVVNLGPVHCARFDLNIIFSSVLVCRRVKRFVFLDTLDR